MWLCSFNAAAWEAEKVMSGLLVPWGRSFVSNDQLLVTERNGDIVLVDLKTQTKTTLLHVASVAANGQGGLLDVALSPHDPTVFYFTYSKQHDSGVDTTLAMASWDGKTVTAWRDVLITVSNSTTTRHFGSRIAFDATHLYFTIGDRGMRPNGQDRRTHAGSVLRLNLDGTTPDDNPFAGNPNAQAQIWSYGHRNPQGLYYDAPSQTLWEIEHGPRGGDEINLIRKGANYGWATTSYGKEYWGPVSVGDSEEADGIDSPRKVYIPSIAPSGLLLYRGQRYPQLNGKLLTGALKLTHINVITLDDNQSAIEETRLLESLNERIRDIRRSPDDWIYFSTDSGNIYRLKP
ncbi:PQQ-dependent sugar dehydrogenase [Vibrio furnissii]|uniref:PQQ-dependent sugar dehydrogenase n=1 Tax=Vibrio furnissii TaxID=29494 RepID=UPI001EEB5E7B|nr:PQQ-dependent sugar dehydrogenase [Vibrio furnissii]MCG6210673.1 PQQ-dependent sugar dehydrogenase [Vibrio furnissii]